MLKQAAITQRNKDQAERLRKHVLRIVHETEPKLSVSDTVNHVKQTLHSLYDEEAIRLAMIDLLQHGDLIATNKGTIDVKDNFYWEGGPA